MYSSFNLNVLPNFTLLHSDRIGYPQIDTVPQTIIDLFTTYQLSSPDYNYSGIWKRILFCLSLIHSSIHFKQLSRIAPLDFNSCDSLVSQHSYLHFLSSLQSTFQVMIQNGEVTSDTTIVTAESLPQKKHPSSKTGTTSYRKEKEPVFSSEDISSLHTVEDQLLNMCSRIVELVETFESTSLVTSDIKQHLESLLHYIFVPTSFFNNPMSNASSDETLLHLPPLASTLEDYITYISNLPEKELLTILKLNGETYFKTNADYSCTILHTVSKYDSTLQQSTFLSRK